MNLNMNRYESFFDKKKNWVNFVVKKKRFKQLLNHSRKIVIEFLNESHMNRDESFFFGNS